MDKSAFLVSIRELENISFQAGQVQERILAISAIITDEDLVESSIAKLVESSTAKLVEKLRVLEEQRAVLNGKIIQLTTIDNE